MVYNDLFNYGLFIHMTYLSYGRMSPQQKNNQQSSVFDMLYAFDWHYLYMSLSWKDGRRSIFQSIFMFLISTLTPWHKTQFSKNINFPCFRLRQKQILFIIFTTLVVCKPILLRIWNIQRICIPVPQDLSSKVNCVFVQRTTLNVLV